ncbi:MAG: hypothetical protein ACO3LE_00155 [Bdellovibrionota bacterium]
MDISGGGSSNVRQATAAATPSAQAEVPVDESAASSSNASNQADARRLSAQEQRVSAPDASADTSSSPKAPVSSKDNLSNALARARSSDLISEGQTNAAPPVAEATAREAARPVESESPKAAADGGKSNKVKANL